MARKTTKQKGTTDVQFILANERTLLSWVRTGLALIAGGTAVAFLATDDIYGSLAGFGAIFFGGLLSFVGYWRYHAADRAVRNGNLPATGRGGLWVVIGVILFATILILIRNLDK